jgi:formylglycine-generating enzyme required for sulfatase activity
VPKIFRDCADFCPEMVEIPPGRFQMGSRDTEAGRFNSEAPVHSVSISYPLAVSKFPITRGQWRRFLKATRRPGSQGCYTYTGEKWELKPDLSWQNPGFPQEDNHPVVCVSWQETQDYATWLSQKTHHHYRLLSEAEYEYVNRAGSSTAYFFGNTSEAQCRYANGADATAKAQFGWTDAAACGDGYANTSPVGTYQPNRFGLYDTTGNVWSWTQDCWNENYNGSPTDGSAWTSGDCTLRVMRGGSWLAQPRGLRSAVRDKAPAAGHTAGFRLGRTD